MIITITIDTSSTAFDADRERGTYMEVVRILATVCQRFDDESNGVHLAGPLHDSGGRRVGMVRLEASTDSAGWSVP